MVASKHFIAVAGNIGAGKSTLTGLLSQRMGWQPFYEAVSDNPYLADFYDDMPRYAFHSQVFFLSRRLRHHRRLLDFPGSVVQDRSVYEDAEIFARALHQQGHIVERDYRTYRELYEVLVQFLPPPDLVIYLRASVPTLLRRIAQRGRAFEQSISPGYLHDLNELYEAWMRDFLLCPVLTVPSDRLDFVHDSSHLDLILRKVDEKLSGKEEVVFVPEPHLQLRPGHGTMECSDL
jgi:deoxyadenosine/deoxycytidine kinase